MLVHELDHAGAALARLAQQYKGKPRIEGLLNAFTAGHQAIEDALYQLVSDRTIDDAEGVQLDVLGRIVGQGRGPADDDAFRVLIKGKVRVNKSSGALEELIAVFNAVEPTATITVTDEPPAGFEIDIDATVAAWEAAIYCGFLLKARAAGINGELLWRECEEATSLVLSDAANYPENSSDQGLGDATDDSVGGYLGGAAP